MSGTKIGGLKAAQANKEKYGKTYYQRIGSIGGQNGHGGGFKDRELASKAGRIGGLKSRRGKAKKVVEIPKSNWFTRIMSKLNA